MRIFRRIKTADKWSKTFFKRYAANASTLDRPRSEIVNIGQALQFWPVIFSMEQCITPANVSMFSYLFTSFFRLGPSLPGKRTSWKAQTFPNKAIINSCVLHGTVHHPAIKFWGKRKNDRTCLFWISRISTCFMVLYITQVVIKNVFKT